MKKIFFIICLISIFFLLTPQSQAGLVPCGLNNDDPAQPGDQTVPCTICHLFILFQNILNFLFFQLVPPLAVLMIAIAGIYFIFAGGNPGNITRGKEILRGTAIALLIIYGAWLLINLFFIVIGVADWTELSPDVRGWFIIDCS